jgi:hypothetical protein
MEQEIVDLKDALESKDREVKRAKREAEKIKREAGLLKEELSIVTGEQSITQEFESVVKRGDRAAAVKKRNKSREGRY